MASILSRIKSSFGGIFSREEKELMNEPSKDYVELETSVADEKGKVVVRPFTIEDFADIKDILNSLREGSTIGLINIKPLKDKDVIELKRAINKLKKTTDAIEGDIAGFGDDYIVVTPSFAKIHRHKSVAPPQPGGVRGEEEEF